MNKQEKTSINIATAFVIPFGIMSNIIEFILFKYGPLNELTNLAVSLNDFSNGDMRGGFFGLFFNLLIACIAILFLAWVLRKISGSNLNPDAWKRSCILGFILGLLLPLSIFIPNQFVKQIIILATIIFLPWVIFHNYPFTLEETNEPT